MKDILRRVTKDKRKYIIICAAAVLVIALITVSVIAVQLKHSKNKKKNIAEDTTAETKTIQETTAQATTEEDTTQEESTEVVDQEAVEEFFENEISTENQKPFELPERQITSECIPYDGAARSISYYGDSMVYGFGSWEEGNVNGMNITGWTAPSTIQYFSHIRTYNFGVSGETSDEIAFRAGGINVYVDRDITISEEKSATAKLVKDDGQTFIFNDYSGYAFESNDYPNTMYINGYLCDVNNTDDGMVSIKLTKGYAAYAMDNTSGPVTYNITETQPYADAKEIEESTSQTVQETESSTEKPSESATDASKENPTEPVTEPETKKDVYIAKGSKAVTKAAHDRSANDILILEIGSNGGWSNDYKELILQYDNIIINSGCKYYIIVGDTDDPGTSIADTSQGYYNTDGSYIGIGDTSWEAALRLAYGDHFFNTRTYMIQNGLSDCGLDATTEDLWYFKCGKISKQLRYDWTHFNSYGYYSKGIGIYKKGVELGYWS